MIMQHYIQDHFHTVPLKGLEYPQKLKILKATFCCFTVFLFEIFVFLTKILFLNEI